MCNISYAMNMQQRKYLKGLAHKLKPLVFIGQKGITDTVISAVDDALDDHELIKIRFIDFKEKKRKEGAINAIQQKVGFEIVGRIGHILIAYRRHRDPKKRKIVLPI